MEASIWVAIIAASASIATAALGLFTHKRLGVVKSEVKNSHDTNLRADMDRMLTMLDDIAGGQNRLIDGQRRHDAEIAGIRTDMRIERQARIEDMRIERQERLALTARIDEGRMA